MAALLDRIHLRRHALPACIVAGLDRDRDRRTTNRRPILVATWHIGANGRPTCGWSATGTAGFAPDFPSG
jgi:hypothetical protein